MEPPCLSLSMWDSMDLTVKQSITLTLVITSTENMELAPIMEGTLYLPLVLL